MPGPYWCIRLTTRLEKPTIPLATEKRLTRIYCTWYLSLRIRTTDASQLENRKKRKEDKGKDRKDKEAKKRKKEPSIPPTPPVHETGTRPPLSMDAPRPRLVNALGALQDTSVSTAATTVNKRSRWLFGYLLF